MGKAVHVNVEAEGVQEISVLYPQFFYESKKALLKSLNLKKNNFTRQDKF